jgi:hypothetical protein
MWVPGSFALRNALHMGILAESTTSSAEPSCTRNGNISCSHPTPNSSTDAVLGESAPLLPDIRLQRDSDFEIKARTVSAGDDIFKREEPLTSEAGAVLGLQLGYQ